ncbi:hypothetical protein [Faecalispora anaeroviscerum]|uniref:hypothetical protein n=1 Tax=Faecalispora anaeroviscerum TaxID=2991836 RepID=UPI0024BB8991|nr:hypothetical protein [Faecalispora anaeroviscerum]
MPTTAVLWFLSDFISLYPIKIRLHPEKKGGAFLRDADYFGKMLLFNRLLRLRVMACLVGFFPFCKSQDQPANQLNHPHEKQKNKKRNRESSPKNRD